MLPAWLLCFRGTQHEGEGTCPHTWAGGLLPSAAGGPPNTSYPTAGVVSGSVTAAGAQEPSHHILLSPSTPAGVQGLRETGLGGLRAPAPGFKLPSCVEACQLLSEGALGLPGLEPGRPAVALVPGG